MTEQINEAIEVFKDMKVGLVRFDMTEWCDLAIRSLQAWEEVLQELEEKREYFGNTLYQRKAYEKAIDIINRHLEIEE